MRSSTLYLLVGLVFLLAFAFDLPDLDLHGWLFLLVALASFGVAGYRARSGKRAEA